MQSYSIHFTACSVYSSCFISALCCEIVKWGSKEALGPAYGLCFTSISQGLTIMALGCRKSSPSDRIA